MATRSIIGMVEDREIRYIYCHWDGYPQGVGKMLFQNYQEPAKVKALLDLGDLSQLGREVEVPENPEPNYSGIQDYCHAFATAKDNSNAYARDMGESLEQTEAQRCGVCVFHDRNNRGAEHVYLFDEGVWYHAESGIRDDFSEEMLGTADLKPLSDKIE